MYMYVHMCVCVMDAAGECCVYVCVSCVMDASSECVRALDYVIDASMQVIFACDRS